MIPARNSVAGAQRPDVSRVEAVSNRHYFSHDRKGDLVRPDGAHIQSDGRADAHQLLISRTYSRAGPGNRPAMILAGSIQVIVRRAIASHLESLDTIAFPATSTNRPVTGGTAQSVCSLAFGARSSLDAIALHCSLDNADQQAIMLPYSQF